MAILHEFADVRNSLFGMLATALESMGTRRRNRARRLASRPKRIVRLPSEYFESLELGNLLFPALYQLENGLRLIVNSFLTACYGGDWWNDSLKAKKPDIVMYAEDQKRKFDAMPWIGDSAAVEVLPVHLITLGQLEEIVRVYRSDCIPELFPSIEFFLGHMEVIKRVRNLYSHMFPCITREDCTITRSEIRTLARHINKKLGE
jgi:hypothetical protein